MKFIYHMAITVFLAVAMLLYHSIAHSTELINFCYENKQFWPHYAKNANDVPSKMPGATIEILQQLDKQSAQFVFHYVRKPWLRCLQDLQNNRVQAVIASYDKKRVAYAQYPMKQGNPDPQLAFSTLSACIYADSKAPILWNGKVLSTKNQQLVSVSIPNGYSIQRLFEKPEFIIYNTYSAEKAHDLLFNGRVQASVGSCDLLHIPQHIKKLLPALSQRYGYLIFNKKYYLQHKSLVNRLWRKQAKLDKAAIYTKYPAQPPKPNE